MIVKCFQFVTLDSKIHTKEKRYTQTCKEIKYRVILKTLFIIFNQFVGFSFSKRFSTMIKSNEETMAKTQEMDIKSESFAIYM